MVFKRCLFYLLYILLCCEMPWAWLFSHRKAQYKSKEINIKLGGKDMRKQARWRGEALDGGKKSSYSVSWNQRKEKEEWIVSKPKGQLIWDVDTSHFKEVTRLWSSKEDSEQKSAPAVMVSWLIPGNRYFVTVNTTALWLELEGATNPGKSYRVLMPST